MTPLRRPPVGSAALSSDPVRVRMGVFTGEPIRTGEGYAGLDVRRAARMAAAGHGGQVLVSESSRRLVAEDLEEEYALLDLGEHRLKDLCAAADLSACGRRPSA